MYEIIRDYIRFGNARSGLKLKVVKFIVAHDTGNPGSTARNNRSHFHNNQPSASAHTFIDDKEILEIIPLDEKAWHVQYQKPMDNKLFGDDANDAAIGVELCYGGKIDFNRSYKRYVWYLAYLCVKFGLNPFKHIVGHQTLDPERKTDPSNALHKYGKTYNDLIHDVNKEYKKMKGENKVGVTKSQKEAAAYLKSLNITNGEGLEQPVTRGYLFDVIQNLIEVLEGRRGDGINLEYYARREASASQKAAAESLRKLGLTSGKGLEQPATIGYVLDLFDNLVRSMAGGRGVTVTVEDNRIILEKEDN